MILTAFDAPGSDMACGRSRKIVSANPRWTRKRSFIRMFESNEEAHEYDSTIIQVTFKFKEMHRCEHARLL